MRGEETKQGRQTGRESHEPAAIRGQAEECQGLLPPPEAGRGKC